MKNHTKHKHTTSDYKHTNIELSLYEHIDFLDIAPVFGKTDKVVKMNLLD